MNCIFCDKQIRTHPASCWDCQTCHAFFYPSQYSLFKTSPFPEIVIINHPDYPYSIIFNYVHNTTKINDGVSTLFSFETILNIKPDNIVDFLINKLPIYLAFK